MMVVLVVIDAADRCCMIDECATYKLVIILAGLKMMFVAWVS